MHLRMQRRFDRPRVHSRPAYFTFVHRQNRQHGGRRMALRVPGIGERERNIRPDPVQLDAAARILDRPFRRFRVDTRHLVGGDDHPDRPRIHQKTRRRPAINRHANVQPLQLLKIHLPRKRKMVTRLVRRIVRRHLRHSRARTQRFRQWWRLVRGRLGEIASAG